MADCGAMTACWQSTNRTYAMAPRSRLHRSYRWGCFLSEIQGFFWYLAGKGTWKKVQTEGPLCSQASGERVHLLIGRPSKPTPPPPPKSSSTRDLYCLDHFLPNHSSTPSPVPIHLSRTSTHRVSTSIKCISIIKSQTHICLHLISLL